MAERRMLLNSAETFIGTMRIEYNCDGGKLYLGLNDNIKIIEEYFNGNYYGYYIIGFKKDLIVPENFINASDYSEIRFSSDYNIIFDTRSIYVEYLSFSGNFTFNEISILSGYIELYDYNYTFNDNCFDVDINGSIRFFGKTIPQYYKNINNYEIHAYCHILYDLMKYNGVEEGNDEAKKYKMLGDGRLIISSPTSYSPRIPDVNLGDNNYIQSISQYMYDGNYITEYGCKNIITHFRKGITLPQNATVYFPDTVADIDSNTFENESNSNKVVIFGNCNLTYLDGFYNSGLENIEIYSDKITDIEQSCFANSNLNIINIPKSIKFIGPGAFADCADLQSINYKGTIEEWNNINKYGDWDINSAIKTIHCSDGDIQL